MRKVAKKATKKTTAPKAAKATSKRKPQVHDIPDAAMPPGSPRPPTEEELAFMNKPRGEQAEPMAQRREYRPPTRGERMRSDIVVNAENLATRHETIEMIDEEITRMEEHLQELRDQVFRAEKQIERLRADKCHALTSLGIDRDSLCRAAGTAYSSVGCDSPNQVYGARAGNY